MFGTGENKTLKKYSLRQTVKEVMFDIDLTSGDDSQDSQDDKVIYENALRKCLPNSSTIAQPRDIDHSEIDLSIPNDSLLASLGYRSPRSSPSKCIKPCYSPSNASTSIQSYVSPSKHSRKRSTRSSNQPLQSSLSSFNHDFFPFQRDLSLLPSNISSIHSPSSSSKYALSSSPKSSKSLTPASPLSSTASQDTTITSRTKPRISFANASPVSSASVHSFTPPSSEDSNSDLDSHSDSEYFSSSSSFKFSSQNCKSKANSKPKTRNQSLRSLRGKCLNGSSKPLTQDSNESENPRRSSRTRVKPLEFWRGELPIYKPQANGTFVLDGIVEASSSQATSKRRKSSSSCDTSKRPSKRLSVSVNLKKPLSEKKDSKSSSLNRFSSKTPTSKVPSLSSLRKYSLRAKVTATKDDSEQEQAKTNTTSAITKPESKSTSTKLSQDVSSQTSIESSHVETNTQTENLEASSKKCVKVATDAAPKVTLVDKSTNSDIIPDESPSEASEILRLKNKLNWQVSQTSKDVFLATAEGSKDSSRRRGYLKILRKGEKPSQITGSYDMDLMIIEGKVSVTIGDADAVMFSCPYTFSIPSHTCYSIKNLLDSDAFFSFYIFCET